MLRSSYASIQSPLTVTIWQKKLMFFLLLVVIPAGKQLDQRKEKEHSNVNFQVLNKIFSRICTNIEQNKTAKGERRGRVGKRKLKIGYKQTITEINCEVRPLLWYFAKNLSYLFHKGYYRIRSRSKPTKQKRYEAGWEKQKVYCTEKSWKNKKCILYKMNKWKYDRLRNSINSIDKESYLFTALQYSFPTKDSTILTC